MATLNKHEDIKREREYKKNFFKYPFKTSFQNLIDIFLIP